MDGICHLSYIPIRAENSGRSEQVSQLIYGETYRVINEQDEWLFIRTNFDHYEGYISRSQFLINQQQPKTKLIHRLFVAVNQLLLPCGAEVSGEHDYSVEKDTFKGNQLALIQLALQFINTPYLWGGRTFMGIDCSGFVQVVFKANGYNLPRDAYEQQTAGQQVSFGLQQQADVAFFKNGENKITHTGILIDDKRIIHAHGCVRIDYLDQEGIKNMQTGKQSHQLHSIKRFI